MTATPPHTSSSSSQSFEHRHLSSAQVITKRARTEDRLPGLSSLEPMLERFPQFGGKIVEFNRTCPKCGDARKNNRIYCYECLVPVGGLILPTVLLPIKLDIIRHPNENKHKSTSLHAPVLCGNTMVRYVEVPHVDTLGEFDPEKTILLFPTEDSVTVSELQHIEKIDRVVVIDSTWQQTRSVLSLPQLSKLRRVRLANNYQTSFWRYQLRGEDHLATIEAIYFFYREWVSAQSMYEGGASVDQLDNLLYIFLGMLRVIEAAKAAPSPSPPPSGKEEI